MRKLTNETREELSFYLKLLPIALVLLICLGYLYINDYYNLYGLDIALYLNNSDILTSFLPMVKAFILPVAMVFALFYLFLGDSKVTPDEKDKATKEGSKWKRLSKKTIVILFFSVVGVAAMVIISVLNMVVEAYFGRAWMMLIIITAIILIGIVSEKGKVKSGMYMILFSVIYFSSNIYYTNKYLAIKEGKRLTNVTFNYEGETISTTKNIVYIGQTKEYLFLHEFKSNTNFVYELSRVSKLQVSRQSVKLNWKHLSGLDQLWP